MQLLTVVEHWTSLTPGIPPQHHHATTRGDPELEDHPSTRTTNSAAHAAAGLRRRRSVLQPRPPRVLGELRLSILSLLDR